jgi:23S rRNA (guanosine2251-2'-O)-methyltransferase
MRETLYGRQAIRELLRAGRRDVYRLFLIEGTIRAPIVDEIVSLAEERGVSIQSVSRYEMERMFGDDNHQGVAVEASEYPYAYLEDMLDLAKSREEPPLLLMLDLIQDVHNLGSLIRTADAVGAHGVVLQGRRAAGVTSAVVNTSSGAVEHLLVGQVTNLARTLERLKDGDMWIVGLEDVYGAKPYMEADLTVSLGLVVGSEGNGIRRLVRERCDWMISIPMRGKIASLNAAVAGSIALYEVLRQRTVY